jgi:hypothetical protein
MYAMEMFEIIREADCYPNTSIAYRVLFTMPMSVALAFFDVDITEELFEIFDAPREVIG